MKKACDHDGASITISEALPVYTMLKTRSGMSDDDAQPTDTSAISSIKQSQSGLSSQPSLRLALRAVDASNDRNITELLSADTPGNRSSVLLVAGHPLSGKSTLLLQLYNLWLKGEALRNKTALWWDLSQATHRSVNSLQDLVSVRGRGNGSDDTDWRHFTRRKPTARDLQANGGREVVIIIDNFRKSTTFLSKLLSRSIIPQCSLIIAVQYSQVEMVLAEVPVGAEYEVFEINGFLRTNDVREEILRRGKELKVKSVDRLSDYVCANPDVQELCCYPDLLRRVLEHYEGKRYQCPKTITSLMQALVEDIVTEAGRTLTPEEVEEQLDILYHLAYLDLKCGGFSRYEFSCLCSQLSISDGGTQLGLGLMQLMIERNHVKCKFVHRSIQMYLAAMHLRKKPIYDQAFLTMEVASDMMKNKDYYSTFVYYCGTAHTYSGQTSSLNVSKIILYPLLESMAEKILPEDSQDPRTLLLFLRCLHEAQEPSIVRKFLNRRQHLLTIELDSDEHLLAESNLIMLSYCVAHSVVNRWRIEAAPESTFLMEYFKMLTTDQLSSEHKSSFEIKIVVGTSNRILPTEPKAIPSSKPKSNVYSKITRELLHRLLQLHSPIKLKSDGSNASYISLLSCECLQKIVDNEGVLAIECISPNHWLPMKKKERTSTQSEVENPQTFLHMQRKHEGQHIEYVLMMSPLPNRIKFTMPGTREKIIIQLCTDDSPDFLHSGIEDKLTLASEQSFFQDNGYSSSKAKIILPTLPLPKQTNSSAVTVVPDAPEPIRPSRQLQQRFSNREAVEDGMATPIASTTHHLLVDSTDEQRTLSQQRQNRTGAHRVSPLNLINGSEFEQSEQQSLFPKHTAMKPGVVIHTRIPEIFSTDQQYPLPDESHLLRKGGNGEIYVGVFGGKELVVKKTSYRNREYLIHSKLQHQNIIPLQCLMIGERHSSQRRKLLCYHFLPRANGDLAKLAIDSEKNTLKQLKIDLGQDVKLFGSVQGNLRYLLTQILKGLVYLHNLDIVHRDVKASNILLSFRCSCTNPLLCTCSNKCSVQIADFDSAIQLVDGRLPATSSRSGQRERTFVVVPVGTHGYRPPESSQLTVSNDVTALSPHVTTRADVWSFGVLVMKMLNGNYGPASQRELSTLLLMYHQEKCTTPSLPMPSRKRVVVTSKDLNRVLKLSKLQRDVHWNPRAIDCVQQCLQVDPDRRTTAQELLQHPFLY